MSNFSPSRIREKNHMLTKAAYVMSHCNTKAKDGRVREREKSKPNFHDFLRIIFPPLDRSESFSPPLLLSLNGLKKPIQSCIVILIVWQSPADKCERTVRPRNENHSVSCRFNLFAFIKKTLNILSLKIFDWVNLWCNNYKTHTDSSRHLKWIKKVIRKVWMLFISFRSVLIWKCWLLFMCVLCVHHFFNVLKG